MQKLDKIDFKILYELDKNARIPETRLAKIVGKSKESVRHRIKKLQRLEIIQGFTIWIDPTKLGFMSSKIYFNLANKPEQRKRFVQEVNKDKRLFWLGLADGAWNAGLTYFVKSTEEFFDLKNELFSRYKELILESHTAMLVNVNVHDKTFLCDNKTEWRTIFGSPENVKIDKLEQKILKELFADARINVVEIARRCKSTADIVRNRIKRLEEQKIIFKYTARIDFTKLGFELYKTFVYFSNLTKQDEKRLMEYCKQNKNMIHLIKQISPWDIELETMCKNYQEYNRLISELTKEFSEVITKVETAIMGEDYVFPAKEMIFE